MKKISIENILEEKAPIIDKAIEKYIPRRYDKDSLVFTLGPPRFEYHLQALNKAVAEPVWEFLDRGGKRWRPTLFLLVCEALGKDPKEFLDFAIIPEVIHNGLIMIDDIEDSSESRRGKPCTHKLFGLDIAINAGNEMFYLPLLTLIKNKEKLPPSKMNKIYEIYVQEMINVGFGQAMDIAWHRGLANADEISQKQYMQMCAYKTGTIARMSAKIATVLADASDDVVEKIGRFAESIGVAFQIQDDILDLVSEAFAKMKGGLGQDITEGKRTLMVIHTLEKAEPNDRKRLLEILNMHTTDQRLRDKAINIIRDYGSIDYTKNYARRIVSESWKDVDDVLSSSEAKEKLKAFADYLIERQI
ncbi:MAG: polyprenyl synthetase family protein [Candidatus Bathyarchaeota archaeon]|nr:polyprenyl synthetase family protein [Candidatus Bathyarchaeota archaeon]